MVQKKSASPPAVSAVVNMAYIPNNSSAVPVAAAQPEVGISPYASRPSLPVKFVSYSNLTAGNGGGGSQYSQPIVGHMGSRTHPVRYAGQYHPVQTGPTYVHPNSQAVMVGRLGQLFYVHPVSHVKIQCITPRTKLKDEQWKDSNTFMEDVYADSDDMENKSDVSDTFTMSVGSSSSNHLDSSSHLGELV